jgi:general stress protein 26
MTLNEQLQLINSFIKSRKFCVISTVNSRNEPQSAVMAYSEKNENEIIFQTPNYSRKYQNIKVNTHVSVAIGWEEDDFITLQYEGIAREVYKSEVDEVRKVHVGKSPQGERYAYVDENKYFVISPKWIRYSDLIKEITFEIAYDK